MRGVLTSVRYCKCRRQIDVSVMYVCYQGRQFMNPLRQWSQTQFLEGHSSAELQLTPAWKFLVILQTLISWIRCVWLGLELNYAELWPSRNWVWDQCFKAVVFKPVLQAPLPCTFCMSSLSDTPDSTHQLISRDCKTWIGCLTRETYKMCRAGVLAGQV